MGWFKNWREKRNSRNESTKELKRPESSYDLYHQNETLTLQPDIMKEVNKDYKDEKILVSNTSLDIDKSSDKTKTTSIKKGVNMADKKGRNIYYVSARKDKKGKKVGWEIKKENAEKVTKVCETKEEAIEFVREKAGNQGSTCIIRKMDGSIDKTMKFDTNK